MSYTGNFAVLISPLSEYRNKGKKRTIVDNDFVRVIAKWRLTTLALLLCCYVQADVLVPYTRPLEGAKDLHARC
eukprot:SAG11_NODE_14620_length_605_cov_1.859684_1_plen_73_part_10